MSYYLHKLNNVNINFFIYYHSTVLLLLLYFNICNELGKLHPINLYPNVKWIKLFGYISGLIFNG